jgi:SPP1 family holin
MDKSSIVRMVAAALAAIKLILQPFGVELPQEVIDSIADVVAAVVVLYTAWKNNYISNKGKKQKEVLKKNNLA